MSAVIEISQLNKAFGHVQALNDFDMAVEAGEIHGFLGPNGAGKTTAIRVLLGLLRADSGEVRMLGGDPWHDAVRLHERLRYVPGDVALWPGLSGGEVIDLLGRMNGGLDEKRRAQLLERFQLDPSKKARTYSKGNRQKVALVAALSSRAELYLLDEPTSGLDPLMEAVFQECVHELKDEGATVLLSSHILAEVEALCDRVSIIRDGVNVLSGTLTELREFTRTTVIAETERPATGLAEVPGVHQPQLVDGRVTFDVDSTDLQSALTELTKLGVKSLQAHPPTLEELFLRQYVDEAVSS